MNKKQHIISATLQRWYQQNKRELPWRCTSDAYKIWVSEVVLQQTRVAQGLEYYNRFIRQFPSVESLAKANQDAVLKVWQGLGYYSRARNMHFAAKQVMDSFNGIFPDQYNDLLKLKGIGEYTAAAVASISADEPVAVVDGNVDRVLSRLFLVQLEVNTAKGKKQIKELANSILDRQKPGNHNQAIMELGALICSPKNPACNTCPVEKYCVAKEKGKPLELPLKRRNIKQRKRFFNYFFVHAKQNVYLKKRPPGDIWDGLYELVLIESSTEVEAKEALKLFNVRFDLKGDEYIISRAEQKYKHVLSHQIIYGTFYALEFQNGIIHKLDGHEKIAFADASTLPIARITDRYFKSIGLFA